MKTFLTNKTPSLIVLLGPNIPQIRIYQRDYLLADALEKTKKIKAWLR